MKQKEIIKLIKLKDTWDSDELIQLIQNNVSINFCHIGGYELLRDGTKTEQCHSLIDVQGVLINWEIEFDESITDVLELVKSIESAWEDSFDDGGGSGWIEY